MVVMTESERLRLVRLGDEVFAEVLAQVQNAEGKRESESPETRGKYLTLLDSRTVYGSLEEVADLYLNDDKKLVLDFSESRELVALQRPSPSRPLEHTSLRWSLFRSPNRRLAKDHDFCYLESMRPYRTPDGRRGWTKCSHSVEHAACPAFQCSAASPIDVHRGELHYCGVLFQETSELGVLDVTFYYNVERSHIPQALVGVVLKARGKRNAELLNHYVKMSRMIIESKSHSLTMARQLQAERRCGACSSRMPRWKSKDKCAFCGAFMCHKCTALVTRNYRVDDLSKRQVSCFACAEARGTKLLSLADTGSSYSLSDITTSSKSHSQSRSTTEEDEEEGEHQRGRAGSHPSTHSLSHASEDENKARSPLQASLNCVPDKALGVPAEYTMRKPKSSSPRPQPHEKVDLQLELEGSKPRQKSKKMLDVRQQFNHLMLRQRSHTTASPASAKDKPTSRAPSRSAAPPPMLHRHFSSEYTRAEAAVAAAAGSAALGSPIGLSLEEVNLRQRSFTTDAMSTPKPGTRERHQGQLQRIAKPPALSAKHSSMPSLLSQQSTSPNPVEHRHRTESAAPPRSASMTTPMAGSSSTEQEAVSPTTAKYTTRFQTTPCDLSYLADFK